MKSEILPHLPKSFQVLAAFAEKAVSADEAAALNERQTGEGHS